ncbi:MAG: lytic transglycosylase domain-containing protein [Firmicutes bacterium]|nr:lytic transglycosylase domain-containing protein [Bacillota bacterium]
MLINRIGGFSPGIDRTASVGTPDRSSAYFSAKDTVTLNASNTNELQLIDPSKISFTPKAADDNRGNAGNVSRFADICKKTAVSLLMGITLFNATAVFAPSAFGTEAQPTPPVKMEQIVKQPQQAMPQQIQVAQNQNMQQAEQKQQVQQEKQVQQTQQVKKEGQPTKAEINDMIEAAAKKNGIPSQYVKAIAWQESRWRTNLKSFDGGHGKGVMQIDDRYHSFAKTKNVWNAEDNIEYGAKYLKTLYEQKGSWKQAVISYNGSSHYWKLIESHIKNEPWSDFV